MTFEVGLGFDDFAEFILQSPTLPYAAIMLAVALLIVYLLNRPKRLNLPVVGRPGSKYYGDELLEGVSKVGGF
jgi:hypothetical protein